MNPYEILGVDRNAKDKTIKKAYMEMTRKWHPDLYHNKEDIKIATAKMQEINAAWELIGSPESRAIYDKEHPFSVYEYYAKKQASNRNTAKQNTSTDIEMEKQRKAVLEFLNVEYKHKNDIFDMFAELATLALKNKISDVDYIDTLELIFEEVKECIRNIEKIISVAKSKNLTGMYNIFAKAAEAIEELEKKADGTPKTLNLAHYAEETRILSEKISNLMSKLPKRINAVTQFNLLRKTWEFKDDKHLNSVRKNHKKQVEKLLEDIDWIQKTALERNIKIESVDLNPAVIYPKNLSSLNECREIVKNCEEVLNLNLQGLREKFWKELCEYTKNVEGGTVFTGIRNGYFYPVTGDFICPPNIDRLISFSFNHFNKVNSISIPASLILKEKDIAIEVPPKRLIFTFGKQSQVIDASIFSENVLSLSSELDCICISTPWWRDDYGFALVSSNDIFLYDKKNLCSLYGVKDLNEISDPHYPRNPKERFFVHTWAQVAKKLPDLSIMESLPCTVESIRNWLGLRKINFDISFSKVDKYSREKLVRLYIALGALNDTHCHAQAEWLISKLDVSTMYRSRLERFPEENKTNTNPVFSVPKLAVDFVEANISNKDFLPYVYIFLEGYKFFQSEAKKAKVSLTPNFVISTAPQYVFHSKSDGISDFAIELLKSEKSIESKLTDEILHLRREHNNNLKKNIIETTDIVDNSAMHYKYLDLKSLHSYLDFGKYFRLKKSYHRIEAENVFLSSNSHAIEIINGENKRVTLVILNLLDEGELFADILYCNYDDKNIAVLETIRRALIDQKNSNNLVTGISIGSNEDPNTSNENRWRDVTEYHSDIEWLKNVKWIKFEYLFKSRALGTSYKGYRARFMVEGHKQQLNKPNPYDNPRNRRRFNRW